MGKRRVPHLRTGPPFLGKTEGLDFEEEEEVHNGQSKDRHGNSGALGRGGRKKGEKGRSLICQNQAMPFPQKQLKTEKRRSGELNPESPIRPGGQLGGSGRKKGLQPHNNDF